jgi:TM2 domain-containing membrane protein YozV
MFFYTELVVREGMSSKNKGKEEKVPLLSKDAAPPPPTVAAPPAPPSTPSDGSKDSPPPPPPQNTKGEAAANETKSEQTSQPEKTEEAPVEKAPSSPSKKPTNPMKYLNLEYTRKSFWGEPQYTKKGMFWFTFFFGFFGLHHFYLRSPQTGLLCLIVNFLGFGYWWVYDLIQLSTHTDEELDSFGLDTPYGPIGLAQGMFATAAQLKAASAAKAAAAAAGAKEGKPGPPGIPNPLFTLLYFFCLPFFNPAAIAVAGDTNNALLRLLYILPFTPLFLLNIFAWFYDIYRAIGTPKTFFTRGVSRFMPFTWLGFDVDNQSPNIQRNKEPETGTPCEKTAGKKLMEFLFAVLTGLVKILFAIPIWILSLYPPAAVAMNSFFRAAEAGFTAAGAAAPVVKETVVEGVIPIAKAGVETGAAVIQGGVEVAKAGAGVASDLAKAGAAGAQAAATIGPSLQKLEQKVQSGGALRSEETDGSSLPTVALPFFSVVALLVIFAGSFSNTLGRRRSDEPPSKSSHLDDPPPLARRV